MAVERPLYETTMEAYGGSVPETDAMSTEGAAFTIDEPNAVSYGPLQVVSEKSTSNDIPKFGRQIHSGVDEKPENYLNLPY